MIDKARLTEKCRGLGIPLTLGQAEVVVFRLEVDKGRYQLVLYLLP